jgi:hypothetical protein
MVGCRSDHPACLAAEVVAQGYGVGWAAARPLFSGCRLQLTSRLPCTAGTVSGSNNGGPGASVCAANAGDGGPRLASVPLAARVGSRPGQDDAALLIRWLHACTCASSLEVKNAAGPRSAAKCKPT